MSRYRKNYWPAVIAAGVLALTLLSSPMVRLTQAQGGLGNPGVLPPNSRPYGKSYGEWSAKWWQWAYSLPIDRHPLYDTAPCGAGQSGPVWFLGGSFFTTVDPSGTITAISNRRCGVPADKALFFPIANAEASTIEGNGTTDAELRAAAQGFQDGASNLSAEIDRHPVRNLEAYRVQSPLYTFGPLPDNNILQSFGLTAPAGSTSLSVADGVYLMLPPLSLGPHELHFHAEAHAPGFDFLLDATYHLMVVPRSVPF